MEKDLISQSEWPGTRERIAGDLKNIGVVEGMSVIVHSSLSSLGWVCGGAVAVIQALMDAVTEEGTIVMPTHSGDLSDPAEWGNPPVPSTWWPLIRETMPAFDPQMTPCRGMGAIPELFRRCPGVVRSNHPTGSFAAWGKHAREITAVHELESELGDQSPLARLYDLDGWVLLLGAGFNSNTSFHLAEYRLPQSRRVRVGSPIMEDGKQVWKEYTSIDYRTEEFPRIGEAFGQSHTVRTGYVCSAYTRLFRQREAVDFAEEWLGCHEPLDESE